MNSLELTKWLLKVRDALAEQDEVRRNSMLHAADRFRKESNQQSSCAFRTTRNRERGRGENARQFVQPEQGVVEPRQGIEPKKLAPHGRDYDLTESGALLARRRTSGPWQTH